MHPPVHQYGTWWDEGCGRQTFLLWASMAALSSAALRPFGPLALRFPARKSVDLSPILADSNESSSYRALGRSSRLANASPWKQCSFEPKMLRDLDNVALTTFGLSDQLLVCHVWGEWSKRFSQLKRLPLHITKRNLGKETSFLPQNCWANIT